MTSNRVSLFFASLFLFLALFCLFGEFPPTTAFCVTRGSSLSYTYLARLFPCRSINHLTAQQSFCPSHTHKMNLLLVQCKDLRTAKFSICTDIHRSMRGHLVQPQPACPCNSWISNKYHSWHCYDIA